MIVSIKARIRVRYLDLVGRFRGPVKDYFEKRTNWYIEEVLMRLTQRVPYTSWLSCDSRLLVVHTCLQMARVALMKARVMFKGSSACEHLVNNLKRIFMIDNMTTQVEKESLKGWLVPQCDKFDMYRLRGSGLRAAAPLLVTREESGKGPTNI